MPFDGPAKPLAQSEFTSQVPVKTARAEDQLAAMQFGFFLLLTAAAVLTSCEVASASADVAATLSTSPHIAKTPDAADKGARFLRTGVAEDAKRNKQLDEEERAGAWYEYVKNFLAKALGNPKKADLTKTFPSPPQADVLHRSKSFAGKNTAAQKLTRSQSLPNLNAIGIDDVKTLTKTAGTKDLEMMDRLKQTPDDVVEFFRLDTKLLANANRKDLYVSAGADEDKLGRLLLWYNFNKYYQQKHPDWVSSLVVKAAQ